MLGLLLGRHSLFVDSHKWPHLVSNHQVFGFWVVVYAREVRPHVFMNLCFYWFVFISVLLFPVVSLFPGPKICFVLLFLILKLLKPEASQWSIFNVAEHSFGSLWVYVICQIMAREVLQLTSWNLHWNKWKIYWWKVLIDQ